MDLFESKHSLFWFTARAHNTVNARLGKPQIDAYRDAYALYAHMQFETTRNYYFNYVANIIATEQGLDGLVNARKLVELRKAEYTTFRPWTLAVDWAKNSVTMFLDAHPDVQIAWSAVDTRKLQPLPPGGAPVPAPPRTRLGGGPITIRPGVVLPRSLVSR
jgi:hypothetical protein